MSVANPERRKEFLVNLEERAKYILDKTYMPHLREHYTVFPFHDYLGQVRNRKGELKMQSNIRTVRINRWVYDADELIRDGFKNVLAQFAGGTHNIALIIQRTPEGTATYFAVKNEKFPGAKAANASITSLQDSLRGNFSGTDMEQQTTQQTEALLKFTDAREVSMLCGIPSEKSENYISQGIEKLLNGLVPVKREESYTCVILAQPMQLEEVRGVLREYESIASALTPYSQNQVQLGRTRADTKGTMNSNAYASGRVHTKTDSENSSKGMYVHVNAGFEGTGLGAGFNRSSGSGRSQSDADSVTNTRTGGTNESMSMGESENISYSHKSYTVSNLIKKLETVIERVNKCQTMGLWRTAVYIFSEKNGISGKAARLLNSIMQGEESYLEPPYIQTWYQQDKGNVFEDIRKYVSCLTHPVFVNGLDKKSHVTATANTATAELANLISFPRYSVQGQPVVGCARFGREPHSFQKLQNDIALGCAYHMHQKEEQNRIFLSRNELTKHMFIAGSTGSGKSNTVCHLLHELCLRGESRAKFLVIEPSKGEYKYELGGWDGVTVYGTNPNTDLNLLQINPFAFEDDIHVLEHIDHLTEIFNACWPMYAAMPVILKESIERAYEECGWNLKLSKNPGVYPSFDTLLKVLPEVIDSSAYSADTGSDYKGALVTRVRSLTRGIQGMIFNGNISSHTLFNSNVIIDISRIEVPETNALIMGILILKLQEFRRTEKTERNSSLRHVTVLEEAHCLLRRTTSEQTQESSNLQGKSVEMLADSIAKMRTYGEGFIIADQAPGLMDMSVIRNTNTKIILRLPDEGDRMLVGKAIGLNDSQIEEISRLEQGVAVVSQSGWLEPVLCMVDKFQDGKQSGDTSGKKFGWTNEEGAAVLEFLNAAFDISKKKITKDTADKIRKWYKTLGITRKDEHLFENVLTGKRLEEKQRLMLVFCAAGRRVNKMYVKEDIIAETERVFMARYGIDSDEEVMKCIRELVLIYGPWGEQQNVERLGRR